MTSSWGADFRYSYYRELLNAIKMYFEPHLFSDAPKLIGKRTSKTYIFLRHDIDFDLNRALIIAKMEYKQGIISSFMVMTNCPFYSLNDKSSKSTLLKIKKMGHEVGLHFNLDRQIDDLRLNNDSLVETIEKSASQIENLISSKIHSFSFHRPLPQLLHGPLFLGRMINAYSLELMDWYLSDSKGNWREGELLPKLKDPKKPLLQLLIHPFWWGTVHMNPGERLQYFFEEKTHNLNEQDKKLLSDKLESYVSISRNGKTQTVKENGN